MKMTYQVSITATFYVAYHESSEGGMDYGSHGDSVDSLPEAVEIWRDATRKDPKRNWVICCEPNVQVK